MKRQSQKYVMNLAVAACLGLAAAGCASTEEFQRGYLVDEQALATVKKGMGPEQVLQTLGTPSTVSTVGNKSWYYISQQSKRQFQFMGEKITDQKVTAVYFDSKFKVERVALYGIQDGKVFDFISRTTPAGGADRSFVSQLLTGLMKFE